jgi:hypothetical protein
MKHLLLLSLGMIFVWASLAVPAHFFFDGPPLVLTGLAAGICGIPALLTLFLIDRFGRRSPEDRLFVFILSIALRMGLTVFGGWIAYEVIPLVHQNRKSFIAWGLVFYLLTLIAETTIVYRQSHSSTSEKQNGP